LIANISGREQDIVDRKTALKTAIVRRPKRKLLWLPYCYLELHESDAVRGCGRSMTEIQTLYYCQK